MPEEWLSIAQAAATMKVHPRTIERRIVANKISSRKNDDGQVQVLVNLPDVIEPVSSEAFETVKELANQQVDIAAGSASALVRVAQEQALRAENQLLLARQDAGRYRKESRLAVGLVATILVIVIGAVWWCTRTITQSQNDVRRASDSARSASEDAKSAQERLASRDEKLDQAIAAKAKAEGELAAYKGELAAYKTGLSNVLRATQTPALTPATQPGLIQRMSQAFIGN